MCQRCVDAVKKHLPNCSGKELSDILFNYTAFPYGEADQIELQVAEYFRGKGK